MELETSETDILSIYHGVVLIHSINEADWTSAEPFRNCWITLNGVEVFLQLSAY